VSRRITWVQASLGLATILIIFALFIGFSIVQLTSYYYVRLIVAYLVSVTVPAALVLVAAIGFIIRLAGGGRREIVLGCLVAVGTIEAAAICVIAGFSWF
jgi:hypothetical protein